MPAELGRRNDGRLMVGRMALAQNALVPLRDILRYSQQEFYANGSICYAEGWAFCQFLLHSGNAKYAKVIPAFVRLARNDSNFEVVTERVLKGIDLDALEAEFKKWMATQEFAELEEDDTGAEDTPAKPDTGAGEGPPPAPGTTPPVPGTGGGTPPGGNGNGNGG